MPQNSFTRTYRATGDIRPARFVKKVTTEDRACAEADANDPILGIVDTGVRAFDATLRAVDNDNILVHEDGAECLLELGGSVDAGVAIKSDADGKGVAALTSGTTAQNHGAVSLQSGSSGEFIRVRVKVQDKVYPAIA